MPVLVPRTLLSLLAFGIGGGISLQREGSGPPWWASASAHYNRPNSDYSLSACPGPGLAEQQPGQRGTGERLGRPWWAIAAGPRPEQQGTEAAGPVTGIPGDGHGG